ncbi:MAG: Trk system potassium transporter TrkA [Ruminiclostridium sp.]|nr:Trk system potassium transporter TrkA [Ruminiclostridium sp.]
MNIIIVGCGKVGQTLAEQLNEDSNNITVIDMLPSKVNETAARYDVLGVVGNGATHITQQEAGIGSADLLIAVTGSDELNLLCCLIAKKAGNCHTIARVRSPQYSSEAPYLKEELGLAMVINPEQAAAAEIARVLRFPSALKIDTFAKGRVELLKFQLPEDSPLEGLAVKEISTKLHCDVLVCTVERGDSAYIANGEFRFMEKDVISMIASPKNANSFFKQIKYRTNSVKDVMIVGGGNITHYLCEILNRSGIDMKVIEMDRERCEELAEGLEHVKVINGDAVDQQVLYEEGIENTGGFVALTNLDEENILLSLFAKSVSKCKLITKVNRIDFDDVIRHLEIGTVIYPKNITAESIVRYVRAMKNTIGSNVETLYSIIKGKVDAAEFIIKENSPVIGRKLMEMKLKPNILVASILRDRKVIIPRGGDTIEVGDSVIIVSNFALHDIADILEK